MKFNYVATKIFEPGQRDSIKINIDADAHFICNNILGSFDDIFLINLYNQGSSYRYCSDYIRSDNFLGTNLYPHNLVKPISVLKGTTLLFDIINTSSETNKIQIVLSGEKVSELKDPTPDLYFYVMDLFTPANNIRSSIIKIFGDKKFGCKKIYAMENQTGATSIKLIPQADKAPIMNSYVKLINMFGSVLLPTEFEYTFNQNDTLEISSMNDTDVDQVAQVVFEGIRV